MEELLHQILSDIQIIKQDIKLIKDKLDKVGDSCNEMDEHISFIMKVYETLKNPISMITSFSYSNLSINN
jgi:archaellum component FlaC